MNNVPKNSALYEGWVRHRRRRPTKNEFRYRLFFLYVDLAELDSVFRGRWLWSTRGPALAWLRRADHLGDPALPLDESVRRLVHERIGRRPTGPIRLLTHPRYFGYVMNPVSFFYCFDPAGEQVETIVAEIHNTPWGERHCYVLDERDNGGQPDKKVFNFAKDFHVSPFMGMEQDYSWRFDRPDRTLHVHMDNLERADKIFDATLRLERTEITGDALARVLVVYPWMTAKVIAAIYWQALKLWWKGTPFHPHPKHAEPPLEAEQTP